MSATPQSTIHFVAVSGSERFIVFGTKCGRKKKRRIKLSMKMRTTKMTFVQANRDKNNDSSMRMRMIIVNDRGRLYNNGLKWKICVLATSNTWFNISNLVSSASIPINWGFLIKYNVQCVEIVYWNSKWIYAVRRILIVQCEMTNIVSETNKCGEPGADKNLQKCVTQENSVNQKCTLKRTLWHVRMASSFKAATLFFYSPRNMAN